jgi:NAD(P)-dependent dehydrogenase (short-subunit alcohol dehydrogenase family)
MSDGTIVWISGGSGGIGGGLVRHQPFAGARVINLDLVPAPTVETIVFDLADPSTWAAATASFTTEIERTPRARVRFVHCAYSPHGKGLVTEVDPDAYDASLIANTAGVLAVAAAFVRAVRPEQDAGLAIMSSGAAATPLPGYSNYGPAKAAVEHWVQVVRRELKAGGRGPWVTAVRPGLVDTPTARAASQLDATRFPLGASMRARLDADAFTVDEVAVRIWQALGEVAPPALIDLAR